MFFPNFKSLFSFIFDHRCAHCGKPSGGEYICLTCLKKVEPSPEEDIQLNIPYLDGYKTFTHYEGVAKTILHLVKFRAVKHLTREVGKLAAPFLWSYVRSVEPDYVTFVPTNPWRLWFVRGFDQTEEMLKATEVPYRKLIIRSPLPRKPLSRAKSVEERQRLVKGVFNLDRRYLPFLEGKTVLVVDDLLTSGTTASKVAYLFKSVGTKRVFLFAFFRAVGKKR